MMRTARNQVSKAAINPNRTTMAIGFLKDWLAPKSPAVIAVSLLRFAGKETRLRARWGEPRVA